MLNAQLLSMFVWCTLGINDWLSGRISTLMPRVYLTISFPKLLMSECKFLYRIECTEHSAEILVEPLF